jgi:hypothetical protein
MENNTGMEGLIHTLLEICIEHRVMRILLREDKQIGCVRELCRSEHIRDAVLSQFREKIGSNLDTLPNEIGTAQLLSALETTNLGN